MINHFGGFFRLKKTLHFTGLSFCLVDFLKISRMSQLIILLSSTFQNWPKQLKPTLYSKFKRENNGGVQVN